MTKIKKIITMALFVAMMALSLTACGGSDTSSTSTSSGSSSSSSSSSSDEGVSDETFEAIQTQFAALTEVYNAVKDAHESGEITMTDAQVEVMNQAADVINEMGELNKDEFSSEEEAVELSETIADLAEGLGSIYDAAAASGSTTTTSEGISDETFASVQDAYASLVELYNTVKTAAESGVIELSTEQTDAVNQTADIINEMGNLDKSNFTSENDALDILESMSTLADVLGSVVE